MTHRRTVLASTAALLTATAGCNMPTADTTNDTTTATTSRTQSTQPTSETTTTTISDERNTQPELNQTQYPVAWDWNLPNDPLEESESTVVELITDSNWEAVVDKSVISDASRQFLEATAYDRSAVVAFEAEMSGGKNRLVLHRVEEATTTDLTLTVREWESGSGLNNSPTHLMLLRIPTGDTSPQTVTVTGDFEATTTRS